MRTHYDNLQVQERADPAVIKASYKALAHRYHPDRHPDDAEESARIFRIITEAYEVLSDADKRLKYDAQLRAQREAPAAARRNAANTSTQAPPQRHSVSAEHQGLIHFLSPLIQKLEQALDQVASHPGVPRAIRWLLSPPWRMIVLLQLVLALYLFRELYL
ncbi:DnaJ domain-containing protein [Pseudomonas mosselii]|uniref:DnaJ domain-containing protein n=1 Tax=Pseudomonas mosselii TaxID=78327 RepID=UPI0021D81F6D|nr:DnaJ domain-containing protein [Pseudomonas mosselii]MCU9529333.1 DnaJ domain-containing protein [Pseudomonas mosselii]MCU9536624.1 DnaJ domain-containing protein [Pseudomonas mosselii]MCU9542244.1 DnaJ domain-containing protein [Pseudomonas mosselii]MCU9548349.1 DnaJ domain-containing protein [Pseudomonas mosselii]